MELKNLPLRNPNPDAGRFVDVLLGRKQAQRPPLVEYIVDEHVYRPIVTGLLGREWVPYGSDRESRQGFLDNFIALWHGMGYDFVRYEQGYEFRGFQIAAKDPVVGSEKIRSWADEHHGRIASWEDFEKYPWPRFEDIDFFNLDYITSHLPEGMGFITSHGGGVFEHVSFLFSLEGLWMAVCEQPDLVRAVADRVGELMVRYYRHLLDLPHLSVIFPGDDMGYKSGTLVSPDHLRQLFLPWHKRFAEMTHEKGLPYFLHSCGNLRDIMDDLINDVRIDGKHSFEDIILPVQDFQERYGDRIACLGGVDLNVLAGTTPDEVRKHVRFLMDTCGARGRYAIGSGNSVPSYVPVDNYLAMIDEANTPLTMTV